MLEKSWIALGLLFYLLVYLGGWQTRWRWFLLPLLPWISRSWFLLEPPREMRFFSSTIEGLRGFRGPRALERTPVLLLLFCASCFMPMLVATNLAELLGAGSFALGLTLATGYVGYFKEDLRKDVPIADQLALTLTVLAWLYKFIWAYQLGIGPLLVRGGGLYASNQYIGMMLCVLPFVRDRRLVLGVVVTMLLQFSRGGFLALIVMAVLLGLHKRAGSRGAFAPMIKLRLIVKFLLSLVVGITILAIVAPDGMKFLLIRLVGGGAFGVNIEIADALMRLPLSDLFQLATASAEGDDRGLIWSAAITIAQNNSFVGVGPGMFVTAATSLNSELLYSNAHNLYLTLLAEIGLASLVLFVAVVVVYTGRAWRHSSEGLAALVTFAVYGMFSGQIYETSSEPSITQFVILLFVIAAIDHAREAGLAAGPGQPSTSRLQELVPISPGTAIHEH